MAFHIETTQDVKTCLALRKIVFIDEQGVSIEDEIDGLDDQAIHLLAKVNGRPVGTARLLIDGETGKIGRVCVLQDARGLGLGAALICAGVDELRKNNQVRQVKLGAQVHALGFYEKLGFHPVGDVYDDAGIPHRDMIQVFV